MTEAPNMDVLQLGRCLNDEVLAPLKEAFVGKDEIIDLLGVCLVGRENLFLLGPPGTAKSALVRELAARLDGRVFDYLLTRFTEPNELFGPFDIRKLREGELITNTDGMLPEASFVFLDELLNANSAILNSLLMVLNERVFRRGREMRPLDTLMVVGASNRLPEDDALAALFDRFLLRVPCDNVPQEQLLAVLSAGWRLDVETNDRATAMHVDDIGRLQQGIMATDLSQVAAPYLELVHRLRHAGIPISDRRAVKLQRMLSASALLCGRTAVHTSDLWVLRYIWDREEQQEVLASIVQDAIDAGDAELEGAQHPRAKGGESADAEVLARDLDRIGARLNSDSIAATERSYLRDQLGILAARCQWVVDEQQRTFLGERVDQLWAAIGGES